LHLVLADSNLEQLVKKKKELNYITKNWKINKSVSLLSR